MEGKAFRESTIRVWRQKAAALFLVVALLSAVSVSASAAPMGQEMKSLGAGLTVAASDAAGVTLYMEFPDFQSVEVEKDGAVYQQVSIPDYGTTLELGKPELPTLGRFVAKPKGARVELQVLEAKSDLLSGYRVYPAQEPLADTTGAKDPDFVLDKEFYQRDEFYPPSPVELDSEGVIRGCDTIMVRFNPLQYNPARGELKVYSRLSVRLTFVGGTRAAIDARLRSPYYEDLYRGFLVNYDLLDKPVVKSLGANLQSASGCELLIITHPDFLSAANILANWKRQKGIDTEVRTTAETGSTANAIKSYIQSAYNTWNPAPSFALFLGDAEFVPTNYVTTHPYDNITIGTDLYYATVDGSDYFPDISTGRIPVDTPAEADIVVNKIINYERNPVLDPAFYSKAVVAGYFQDGDLDGYDDRPFIKTSEEIRGFLLGKGYNVQRIYVAPANSNPTNYNNGAYGNGEPLPPDLLRSNGFAWNGNATDITNAINGGAFLVNHRDHGNVNGWGYPAYYTTNLDALANGSKLPVFLSMNCQTGWFDSETDATTNTPATSVYFGEKLLRLANGGAAGIVAATRTSYSGHNDVIDKGIIDAIWPDFLSYTQSGRFANPQRRLGQVLNYAKMYYATIYAESTTRKLEFEIFHYFGDPTMQIWVAPPDQMSVSHSNQCPPGATSFPVDVNVEGALVTVVKGSTILGKATAHSGSATVPLSPAPQDGTLKVTASDPDYVPYQDDVPVGGGPTATLDVSHAKSCLAGANTFVVNVVQKLALVTISQNGMTLGTAMSVNGQTAVALNPPPVVGTMTVIVSLDGWDRYEALVNVVDKMIRAELTPNQGISKPGQKVAFQATVEHALGYQSLTMVDLLVGQSENPAGAVYVRYDQQTNRVHLRAADDSQWLPTKGYLIGSNYVIETKYASLYVQGCRAAGDGNRLTVTWTLAFKNAYCPGMYQLYLKANEEAWQKMGTWAVSRAPKADSVSFRQTVSRGGREYVVTTLYEDQDGLQDLRDVYFLITAQAMPFAGYANAIYLRYDRIANRYYLRNDEDTAWLEISPGESDSVENGLCILRGQSSQATKKNAKTLKVQWQLQFKAALDNSYRIYMRAMDQAQASLGEESIWQNKGQAPRS